MTKTKRIKEIILGIVMILFAVLINFFPEQGADLVVLVMSIALLVSGISQLVYFLKMARYMNGGESVLYRAIIILDLGIFAVTLATIPRMYIMLYLLGYNLFIGAVDVLRALETRKVTGSGWKLKFTLGIITCLISVVGWFNIDSTDLFILIYSMGLITSAVGRMAGAFKKTTVVYIQ